MLLQSSRVIYIHNKGKAQENGGQGYVGTRKTFD
nr:MAG TPA: hypothetical protein [Caudoviricetes sp.]